MKNSKKVPGREGGEIIAQIHRNGDSHRFFSVPHPHAIVNCAEQNGGEQLGKRHPPGAGAGQQLPGGDASLQYGQLVFGQTLSANLISGGGEAKPPGGLLIIFLKAVRFLLPFRHAGRQHAPRRKACLRVADAQVLIDQVPQKVQRPGPIGQNMVNLQADPPAVVEHAEQQAAPEGGVDGKTGGQLFRTGRRRQRAVLQIIPEPAPPEHTAVDGKPLHGPVQGALQSRGLHRFL